MLIALLSESSEEGEEFLCWVTKMSQYFEDKFVQISMNFWLSFTSYFSKTNYFIRQTHRIRNASFSLAIFGKCAPGNYCNDY